MTKQEKEQEIINLLAQPDNITKLIRKNLIDGLPSLPEDVIDLILAILQEP